MNTSRRTGLFAQLLVCLLGLCSPLVGAMAEKGWVEIRSPHFRVVSDGTERTS